MKTYRFLPKTIVFDHFELEEGVLSHETGLELWASSNIQTEQKGYLLFLPPELNFIGEAHKRFRNWVSSHQSRSAAARGAWQVVDFHASGYLAFELNCTSEDLTPLDRNSITANDVEPIIASLVQGLGNSHVHGRALGYFDLALVCRDRHGASVFAPAGLVQSVLEELRAVDGNHLFFKRIERLWASATVARDAVLLAEMLVSMEVKLPARTGDAVRRYQSGEIVPITAFFPESREDQSPEVSRKPPVSAPQSVPGYSRAPSKPGDEMSEALRKLFILGAPVVLGLAGLLALVFRAAPEEPKPLPSSQNKDFMVDDDWFEETNPVAEASDGGDIGGVSEDLAMEEKVPVQPEIEDLTVPLGETGNSGDQGTSNDPVEEKPLQQPPGSPAVVPGRPDTDLAKTGDASSSVGESSDTESPKTTTGEIPPALRGVPPVSVADSNGAPSDDFDRKKSSGGSLSAGDRPPTPFPTEPLTNQPIEGGIPVEGALAKTSPSRSDSQSKATLPPPALPRPGATVSPVEETGETPPRVLMAQAGTGSGSGGTLTESTPGSVDALPPTPIVPKRGGEETDAGRIAVTDSFVSGGVRSGSFSSLMPRFDTVILKSPAREIVGHSRYPLTRAQWDALNGGSDVKWEGDQSRVRLATRAEAEQFLQQLTGKDREEGKIPASLHYRLPTRSEVKTEALLTADGDDAKRRKPFTYVLVEGGETRPPGSPATTPVGGRSSKKDTPLWTRP
jgi:hypothetical protein